MVADTTEVKLRIRERYVVQITPAFKCSGVWPRSAAHWPIPHMPWPHPGLVADVKTEGFDLLSKETPAMTGKQSAMEGDAWVLSFIEAENRLLVGGCRRKCLSILKTLRDRHLDIPGNPVTTYIMKVNNAFFTLNRTTGLNFPVHYRLFCCTSAKSTPASSSGTSPALATASTEYYFS